MLDYFTNHSQYVIAEYTVRLCTNSSSQIICVQYHVSGIRIFFSSDINDFNIEPLQITAKKIYCD